MANCRLSGCSSLLHLSCLHVNVDLSFTIIHGKMDDYWNLQYLVYRPCSTSHHKVVLLSVTRIPPSFPHSPERPWCDVRLHSSAGTFDRYHPPCPLCFHIFHARDVLVESLLFSNIDGKYIRGSCLWSTPSGCMQHRSLILAVLVEFGKPLAALSSDKYTAQMEGVRKSLSLSTQTTVSGGRGMNGSSASVESGPCLPCTQRCDRCDCARDQMSCQVS